MLTRSLKLLALPKYLDYHVYYGRQILYSLRYTWKGSEMEKEEIIEKCQSDMQACLVEMGNQQELLTKIRETGFYDSFVLLEAMNKIAELGGKLNDIQCQLKDLSAAAGKK